MNLFQAVWPTYDQFNQLPSIRILNKLDIFMDYNVQP